MKESICTHHVDLRHGVDENDGEDGDGQAQQEGAGQVPQDTPAYMSHHVIQEPTTYKCKNNLPPSPVWENIINKCKILYPINC